MFNATGKVLTDVLGEDDVAFAVAIQSDGKIVAAGHSFFSTAFSEGFTLVRYTPDGTLDITFNATGKVVTDFSGSGREDVAYALAIQSDGKLVAAGVSGRGQGTGLDFALARYLP
jgi:uncharacterized delta-60 repeat protein